MIGYEKNFSGKSSDFFNDRRDWRDVDNDEGGSLCSTVIVTLIATDGYRRFSEFAKL